MTFLELCRKTAQESGTVSGLALPATVVNQNGNIKKIIGWTYDAWIDVQQMKNDWLWMRHEFSKVLLADLGVYGAVSLDATRHSKFIKTADVTISDPNDANRRENSLKFIEWPDFRSKRLTGKARDARNRPIEWSVNPQGELVIWPTPDIVYQIRGEYQKAPQSLEVDTDVPEMPAQYHSLIWREALVLLAVGTESFEQLPDWKLAAAKSRLRLANDQLPTLSFRAMRPIA